VPRRAQSNKRATLVNPTYRKLFGCPMHLRALEWSTFSLARGRRERRDLSWRPCRTAHTWPIPPPGPKPAKSMSLTCWNGHLETLTDGWRAAEKTLFPRRSPSRRPNCLRRRYSQASWSRTRPVTGPPADFRLAGRREAATATTSATSSWRPSLTFATFGRQAQSDRPTTTPDPFRRNLGPFPPQERDFRPGPAGTFQRADD
jgi:hypothetical protein